MEQIMQTLDVSMPVVLVLFVVAGLQLALQVFCVNDVWRREDPLIVGRWTWTVIVVVGSTIGSLVYLTMGRGLPKGSPRDQEDAAPRTAAAADLVENTVQTLYGPTAHDERIAP